MGYIFFLQRAECIQNILNKILYLINLKPFFLEFVFYYKVLQVHLCALHDDKSVFVLEVLINFHFRYKVALVLDHALALV
jgi:hypothetical protein